MSSEADRYTPQQCRMLVTLAKRKVTPYQLLGNWSAGMPALAGCSALKRPELDGATWWRLDELRCFARRADGFGVAPAKVETSFAESLANLMLFEKLFPQDFAGRRLGTNVNELLAAWDPTQLDQHVSDMVKSTAWRANTHPVYTAWFDMRIAVCCALSTSSLKHLANLGISARAEIREKSSARPAAGSENGANLEVPADERLEAVAMSGGYPAARG